MQVVSGRRRPHADTHSAAVLKANAPFINQAEVLVGSFVRIVDGDMDRDPRAAIAFITEAQSAAWIGVFRIEHETLGRVCTALREAASRWAAIEIGGSLTTRWPLPHAGRSRTTALGHGRA